MEITMRLTCVVNGGCLVEPLDWLAESSIAWEGISFAKDLLDQVVHPSEFFHSAIVLYTYQ